ncbi:MAG: hypothetical protein O7G88_18980 [bacterium]|nr:hypothetical protein [bacterium]
MPRRAWRDFDFFDAHVAHSLCILQRTLPGHTANQIADFFVDLGPARFLGFRFPSPLAWLETLTALIPPPRLHQVRYGGCLAPHSKLRVVLIPTPRQQGVAPPQARSDSPGRHWAQLLKSVFSLDMEGCVGQQGSLRIIAAITQGQVIGKIVPRLNLSADPPPMAARVCQGTLAWASS